MLKLKHMRLLEVMRTHYKAFLVGLVALVLIIIGIFVAIDAAKTARINLLVTPVDAKIKIDGWTYGNGTHRVFPGKKHIEISREGMSTITFDVDCQSGHTTAVNRYLVSGDKNFDFYKKSAESYDILRLIADKDVAEFINKQEKVLLIKEVLPIHETQMLANHKFTKDGMPYVETKISDATAEKECNASLCLKVKTNANDAEKMAKDLLKKYGYDLGDYEVFYEK